MNIWLINHYAVPLKYWPGNRTPQFAKYMLRAGHNVRIIAASTVHNSDVNLIGDGRPYREETVDGVPYTYIKCHQYKGNGLGRISNMLEFPIGLEKVYRKLGYRPDVVLGSSLTPFACMEAIRIARHYKAKSIVEIRDLWPETAVAYNFVSRSNPVLIPFYYFEKKLYEYADDVIFTQEGGYDYIKERGWEINVPRSKVHYVNNGVDLEAFDKNRERFHVEDEDIENRELFKVVYTGSIRRVNNIGKLLDVAKKIKNPRIKFLIWGQGDERIALEKRVTEEKIWNVVFKGYVEKKYVPYIAGRANLNIVHNESTPIWRFGASLNKIFDYMAAGKPILADFPCKYNPIVQCKAGIEVIDPTPDNIAREIECFAEMDAETYRRYCQNARKGAEEYDFKKLTQKLLKIMMGEL